MTLERWLDWAIDDPAPAGSCGYGALNVACEITPLFRVGMLWHSAEGEFWGPPSELMRRRGVSWDATVGRSDVFRHRPRPTFVSWHGGGPAQNIALVGVEVAGARGEPWTPTQRGLILRVALDTWRYFRWQPIVLGYRTDRTQAGIRAAILGRGRGSLWEHVWVKATSCPGGRDDWPWLMAALEAALVGEEEDYMKHYHLEGDVHAVRFMLVGEGLRYDLDNGAHNALHNLGSQDVLVPKAKGKAITALPRFPLGASVGGGTPDEFVDRLKERL